MRRFLLLLPLALVCLLVRADDSATTAGATNVRLNQRSATAPYDRQNVDIKGTDNPGKALGFDENGTLGAIAIAIGNIIGPASGNATFKAGDAAASPGAAAGIITLTAGTASSTGTGGGGGDVSIRATNAGGDNTVTRSGGTVNIIAGNSKGDGYGAGIEIKGGIGGPGFGVNGVGGGFIDLAGGAGGIGSLNGGVGGTVYISAGLGGDSSGTDGASGEIILRTSTTQTPIARLTITAVGNAVFTGPVQLASMTKAVRNGLTAANGMMIYQTDSTPGLRVYENGAWVRYTATADP